MPELRIQKVTATTPVTQKLRLHKITASGTQSTTPKLRLHKITAAGTQAVRIDPIPQPQAAEPGVNIVVTAVLQGDGAADSWTWRRVSGPVATLTPAGASCTIVTPSAMPNPSDTSASIPLVIGVKATLAGTDSPEVTVVVPVLPQTRWTYDGSAWVGARTVPL